MANTLATNPIFLDTAGSSSVIANSRQISPKRLVWTTSTAAHTLVLHQGGVDGGKLIFNGVAGLGGGVNIKFSKGTRWDGLYLKTIGGGSVHIYL